MNKDKVLLTEVYALALELSTVWSYDPSGRSDSLDSETFRESLRDDLAAIERNAARGRLSGFGSEMDRVSNLTATLFLLWCEGFQQGIAHEYHDGHLQAVKRLGRLSSFACVRVASAVVLPSPKSSGTPVE
jgi:hypothetical protein